MKLFKEARMILCDGLVARADDAYARALVAAAGRNGLPVLLGASEPGAIATLRADANGCGVDAMIAGMIGIETASDAASFIGAGAGMLHAHLSDEAETDARIVEAMAATQAPFAVSLRGDSVPPLAETIARLDADARLRPWHYLVRAATPDRARSALEAAFRAAPALAHRIAGVNVDASDASAMDFGSQMRELADRFGLNVIGGAAGMDIEGAEALALALRA